MKRLLLWTLTVQLLSLLCLAHADVDLPVGDKQNMHQREVIPQFPVQEPLNYPVPLLIQEESVMSPRGRRPVSPCGAHYPCSLDGLVSPINNLNDFPPGRPSRFNIGNICKKNREKIHYGPHNLPQTGFSHLSRQGYALNSMEDGYAKCCLQTDKLRCAGEVWNTILEDFCEEEFSIKTRHYHCCKKKGSAREACFNNEAPNPIYTSVVKPAPLQETGSADAASMGRSRSIRPCPPDSPKCKRESKGHLPDLSFPPGEPKSSNIQNICKLRKLRPIYTQDKLPKSGHGYYIRQAKAINRMDNEYKKCCKDENVACAHTAWEKVLAQFCSQELSVKTKHYECCKKRDRAGMYNCFANEAPYPEYDREVETINLSNMTVESLQKLCGESKLLTKQKQIPLLVSGLQDSCCKLPTDSMLDCAEKQKAQFMETLCSTKKDLWKDQHNCCSKENPEKAKCFGHYMQDISVAVSYRNNKE
ncbi:extracellular matrix protein 1 [Rhinophrynus dorsalis]